MTAKPITNYFRGARRKNGGLVTCNHGGLCLYAFPNRDKLAAGRCLSSNTHNKGAMIWTCSGKMCTPNLNRNKDIEWSYYGI